MPNKLTVLCIALIVVITGWLVQDVLFEAEELPRYCNVVTPQNTYLHINRIDIKKEGSVVRITLENGVRVTSSVYSMECSPIIK